MKKIVDDTNQNLRPLPLSRKVNFIICGTQKGGTTALDAYLRNHPEICMANKKEVHYFDNENYFTLNQPDSDYSDYHAFFTPKITHKIIGEATPIYMYWNRAIERIWNYNPEMKLIISLRNPIERAYSHWHMEHMRNTDDVSFWDAITNEKTRSHEALPFQHRVYSYIDRGFYLQQLKKIWLTFPKEKVLIIKQDDLKTKPDKTIQQVCNFLQVKPLNNLKPKIVHSQDYNKTINKEEHDFLRFIFEAEIKAIEQELEWDCSKWLQEKFD